MTTINAYLTFNGNCREAMTFYKKCLGGELFFQAMAESPLSQAMSAKMKQCIVHAVLKKKDLLLMGSDMVGDTGLLRGNAVSLVLNCASEKEIKTFYEKLSRGGEQTHPLQHTLGNALFGTLTDRYGNSWMLNYDSEKK